MRAKSLKSSQILRAHMPYFRRPGHKCNDTLRKCNDRLRKITEISWTLKITDKIYVNYEILRVEISNMSPEIFQKVEIWAHIFLSLKFRRRFSIVTYGNQECRVWPLKNYYAESKIFYLNDEIQHYWPFFCSSTQARLENSEMDRGGSRI